MITLAKLKVGGKLSLENQWGAPLETIKNEQGR